MRVFLYVTEGRYGGLHGVESMVVTEDITCYEDAQEWASEMGQDLIESYDIDKDDEEINWVVWKIKDNVTVATSELDRLCCQLGLRVFVKNYCEKEALW